jgi:hypothetical protein
MFGPFDNGSQPAVEEALVTLRRDFERALAGTGGGPRGNALTVREREVRVDQVRGIASIVSDPPCWSERDGRQLIRTDTRLGRLTLAYVVGNRRYLNAENFARVLGYVGGAAQRIFSADLAQFVNLAVVEPGRDSRRELPVWVTAAYKVATGQELDYFAQEIPELLTDHDPLYADVPESAEYADALLPGATRPVEPTLERYRARLLGQVLPNAKGDWFAHTRELEAYAREHLSPQLLN